MADDRDPTDRPDRSPRRYVVGRPPDDATDDEIHAWARAFVEQILGPATKP